MSFIYYKLSGVSKAFANIGIYVNPEAKDIFISIK